MGTGRARAVPQLVNRGRPFGPLAGVEPEKQRSRRRLAEQQVCTMGRSDGHVTVQLDKGLQKMRAVLADSVLATPQCSKSLT